MSQLTTLLQQAHCQLEIAETIASAHQNATERYQLTTQVGHLRTIIKQIEIELRPTADELDQLPPTIQKTPDDPLLSLSAREREVFQFIVDGKSTSQIASLLYLSEITVRGHRSRILQKLALEDITDLIKFAIRRNLTFV
jgi:DNA-binding NarL/FixJ family response regulator